MQKIILASASPRRQQLLHQIGLDFEVMPSNMDENIDEALSIEETVMHLSCIKAEDIANKIDSDSIVIGADTVVAFEDQILGKPKDDNDAFKMLKLLSGQEHRVLTGFTVIRTGDRKKVTQYEESLVKFYPLTDDMIYSYIRTGEPADKAGAYGIQGFGSLLVEKINGDYFNIVGLPISKLAMVLKNVFGIAIL